MGRDLIQVTGRANYRALSKWAGYDFEADPAALEQPQWLGIGAIWYFHTRAGLMGYARAGNIEMVTRRVNGGLNGYADRLKWYDKTALVMAGFDTVGGFQESAGLEADGVVGPLTRGALHKALAGQSLTPKPVDARPAGDTGGKGFWATLAMMLVGIWKGK
jgi:putative chitinase